MLAVKPLAVVLWFSRKYKAENLLWVWLRNVSIVSCIPAIPVAPPNLLSHPHLSPHFAFSSAFVPKWTMH